MNVYHRVKAKCFLSPLGTGTRWAHSRPDIYISAKRSNQSILKENHPEYSLEGLCWSWNSNTLATWCEELTHWKRPWCWERLKAGGEGDNRGWDGWMASLTRWTWVWTDCWWWTGRPGVLQSMGSERVGHDWVTELNWMIFKIVFFFFNLLVRNSGKI